MTKVYSIKRINLEDTTITWRNFRFSIWETELSIKESFIINEQLTHAIVESFIINDKQNSEINVLYEIIVTDHKLTCLQKQEGGTHYKNMIIQPAEYIHKNGIGFLAGNAIKYISRYKEKNGKEDIKKAIHYLEMILEMEYGEKL